METSLYSRRSFLGLAAAATGWFALGGFHSWQLAYADVAYTPLLISETSIAQYSTDGWGVSASASSAFGFKVNAEAYYSKQSEPLLYWPRSTVIVSYVIPYFDESDPSLAIHYSTVGEYECPATEQDWINAGYKPDVYYSTGRDLHRYIGCTNENVAKLVYPFSGDQNYDKSNHASADNSKRNFYYGVEPVGVGACTLLFSNVREASANAEGEGYCVTRTLYPVPVTVGEETGIRAAESWEPMDDTVVSVMDNRTDEYWQSSSVGLYAAIGLAFLAEGESKELGGLARCTSDTLFTDVKVVDDVDRELLGELELTYCCHTLKMGVCENWLERVLLPHLHVVDLSQTSLDQLAVADYSEEIASMDKGNITITKPTLTSSYIQKSIAGEDLKHILEHNAMLNEVTDSNDYFDLVKGSFSIEGDVFKPGGEYGFFFEHIPSRDYDYSNLVQAYTTHFSSNSFLLRFTTAPAAVTGISLGGSCLTRLDDG